MYLPQEITCQQIMQTCSTPIRLYEDRRTHPKKTFNIFGKKQLPTILLTCNKWAGPRTFSVSRYSIRRPTGEDFFYFSGSAYAQESKKIETPRTHGSTGASTDLSVRRLAPSGRRNPGVPPNRTIFWMAGSSHGNLWVMVGAGFVG